MAPPEYKQEAIANVDSHAKLVQVMVDTVFSFGEPGFQEFRTSDYLTGILAKNGFKITKRRGRHSHRLDRDLGRWRPADRDGQRRGRSARRLADPRRSQDRAASWTARPAMAKATIPACRCMIAAALAIKAVMEKNHIKGRLMLWPGIAEELLGTKAFYVRDGLFKDVDACIFVHVASNFAHLLWARASNGMVSVEYTFHGKTAHAAGDPWDGRSALDAVEIMDVAMNFRREHLPLVPAHALCDHRWRRPAQYRAGHGLGLVLFPRA